MKDSCSCGITVYELDNRKVIIHNIDTGMKSVHEFDNCSDAEKYYDWMTGALSIVQNTKHC